MRDFKKTMISRNDFDKIQKDYEKLSKLKEDVVIKGRTILKLSKEIIYLVNKGSIDEAEKKYKEIRKEYENLKKLVNKDISLYSVGMFKVASQEYVEAASYLFFIKNRKLLTTEETGVGFEYYLLGVCDLTGELVRRAINLAIRGEYNDSVQIKDFVSDLYEEMLKINIMNGELRKKFDSIKYDLKKLEDLVLELKLKSKLK